MSAAGEFRRDWLPGWETYADQIGMKLHGHGTERRAICDIHGGEHQSLCINVDSSAWQCKSCGACGGDVLAHHREVTGAGFTEAAQALGAWDGDGARGAGPTQDELQLRQQRADEFKLQRQAEVLRRQQQAQGEIAPLWESGKRITSHPYADAKGIKLQGLRGHGGNLLVPMRDSAGALWNVQSIDADGEKRYSPSARVKGCYHALGKPNGTIVLCEGLATGASLHEATGHAVAVAFDSGNLLAVATAIRAKLPAITIVMAADDDWHQDGNPGIAKATAAALAVDGMLAIPTRPDGCDIKGFDFNDLHQLAGSEAVKRDIEAAIPAAGVVVDSPEPLVVAASRKPDGVVLTRASDLTPKAVEWAWVNWLALGKLHILAGPPGQGKTTIAIACGGTVTTGGRWPDGTRCTAGNVLIWSGEDDPADTLLPRLIAAGADTTKVHFVTGARIDGEVLPFDPARDLLQLTAAAERIGNVRLLIVDPVVSAVGGDSHKNTEVRRALQPLVDLGAYLNAAVLGISHFSKGTNGRDPTERVTGSVAFGAVARVVMVAAKVKGDGDEDRRVLARSKSNIGPDDGGFEYTLEQTEALPGITASRVVWGKAIDGSARELLTDPNEDADGARDESAKGSAVAFLLETLATITPVKTVQAEARQAGHSWATVRRAANDLPIIRRKGGMNDGWYWSLAEVDQKSPKVFTKWSEPLREKLTTFDPEPGLAGLPGRPDADDCEVF